MIDLALAEAVRELLEIAHRLSSERSIVSKTGRMPDGQRFQISVAVGPAVDLLEKGIAMVGVTDPRSTA